MVKKAFSRGALLLMNMDDEELPLPLILISSSDTIHNTWGNLRAQPGPPEDSLGSSRLRLLL